MIPTLQNIFSSYVAIGHPCAQVVKRNLLTDNFGSFYYFQGYEEVSTDKAVFIKQ